MIVVTGATGNVGAHVVAALRAAGLPVRAFVRDAARARERLGEGTDLVVGDLADRLCVRRALAGIDAVFLATSNQPAQVELETGVIDEAAAAGVGRIVKLSTLSARAGSPIGVWDWQARIEEHLRASGLAAVVVAASTFMSNLLLAGETVRREGCLYAPAGGARIAFVDPRDVAATAAAALACSRWDGSTLVVTGPEALTYADVAAELSAVAGRPVRFVDITPQEARAGMVAAGLPDWLAADVVGMFACLKDGAAAQVTPTVREVTGREPGTLARYVRDHAAFFAAPDALAPS